MPAPLTRLSPRGTAFIRQWRILVLLRQKPRSLHYLAGMLGATERTIRRDLEVLQWAGLPIGKLSAETDDEWLPNMPTLWYVGDCPAWPRRDVSPATELRRATA